MKTIMISIKPMWVKKIASGKKTFEVRKTKPKCNIPFKCLIYCTKNNNGCGKVVGEFICNQVEAMHIPSLIELNSEEEVKDFEKQACMTTEECNNYLKNTWGYAWHISNVKIYDTPKDISDYYSGKQCKGFNNNIMDCVAMGTEFMPKCRDCIDGYTKLKKAPQSWFYIEEF